MFSTPAEPGRVARRGIVVGPRRRGRGRGRPGSGFTLIEVLVALTIVAIALMASIRAAGSLTVSASELRKRTLAQWSAENHLSQIRIERGQLPAIGRLAFQCNQGNLELRCEQEVQTTANPNFRRVDIKVFEAGEQNGQRLARLIGFATTVR